MRRREHPEHEGLFRKWNDNRLLFGIGIGIAIDDRCLEADTDGDSDSDSDQED